MHFSSDFFAPDGPLGSLAGYEYRQAQQAMAEKVCQILTNGHLGAIEAGTGTGKSLAYLYPSICHALSKGEKVVISTNTINLQEQLLAKDIPILKKLGLKFNVVVVKGWNNYPCWQRLHEAIEFHELQLSKLEKLLEKLESNDQRYQSIFVNLAIDTREDVQAESDLCTRGRCSFFDNCPVFMARRQAEKADLVIVNHHLLMADINIRRHTGWDETAVLPAFRHVIVDEAHHIEDVATNYFGVSVSLLRVRRLIGYFHRKQGKQRGILHVIRKRVEFGKSEEANKALNLIDWQLLPSLRVIDETALEFFAQLKQYTDRQSPTSDNLRITSQDLEKPEILTSYDRFHTALLDFEKHLRNLKAVLGSDDADRVAPFLVRVESFREELEFLMDTRAADYVYWLNKTKRHQVTLEAAPIQVGDQIREHFLLKAETVVFTSATLTVNRDFDYFTSSLGINYQAGLELETSIYESPFNYQEQVYLGVIKDLPLPDASTFIKKFTGVMKEILPVTEGRAFILFTSYLMLNEVVREAKTIGLNQEYQFIVQGELDRARMVDLFKTSKNSVLLGTDSFWEGVDVAGDALSAVIITKLPFMVPTDPIVAARSERLLAEGKNPFLSYFLPQAVLKFRQGCGRLIRTTTDRGIILISDRRIVEKEYGRYFLESLSNCSVHYHGLAQISQEVKEWL